MIDASRRRLFRSFFPGARKTDCSTQEILVLGPLTDFPVHSTKKFKSQELNLVLESRPDGLRIREESGGKSFRISIGSGGLLQAHLGESWPATAVLSIFTGEIYNE